MKTSLSSPTAPEIPFELESLANAKRYQRWLFDSVKPYLGCRILEIGSGIGNLSQHLPLRERLILSDVEENLLIRLRMKVAPQDNLLIARVQPGESLSERFASENLDTVVSFNVFEHVSDDEGLLRDLLSLLKNSNANGPRRIVTLVPAHPFAFGEIDKRFGHYRRYSSRSFSKLLDIAAAGERELYSFRSFYINLPALLAWWFKGRVRQQVHIGSGNMRIFEALCPAIRPLDRALHWALRLPFGNSLITVIELKQP